MKRSAIANTGITTSAIGLGSWPLTGWLWGSGIDRSDAKDIVHEALTLGIDLIDTAPVYGLGSAEEIIGDAVKGMREEVILVTKCGLSWDSLGGSHFSSLGGKDIRIDLSRKAIQRDLDNSLKRLQTDYIDIYMPHWPDPLTPIEETASTLEGFVREGKIRTIGASNINLDQLNSYGDNVKSTQLLFNLLDREVELDLQQACIEREVDIMAHSVLAQGLLTGKISPKRVFEGDDLRRNSPRFSTENREKVRSFLESLTATLPGNTCDLGQLSIAWALSKPGIGRVLCGARTREQLAWNAQAGELELADEVVNMLDHAKTIWDIA